MYPIVLAEIRTYSARFCPSRTLGTSCPPAPAVSARDAPAELSIYAVLFPRRTVCRTPLVPRASSRRRALCGTCRTCACADVANSTCRDPHGTIRTLLSVPHARHVMSSGAGGVAPPPPDAALKTTAHRASLRHAPAKRLVSVSSAPRAPSRPTARRASTRVRPSRRPRAHESRVDRHRRRRRARREHRSRRARPRAA